VIDHIIPEAAGGQAVWENLCVACHSCNEFKGALVETKDSLTGRRVHLFPQKAANAAQFLSIDAIVDSSCGALMGNHQPFCDELR